MHVHMLRSPIVVYGTLLHPELLNSLLPERPKNSLVMKEIKPPKKNWNGTLSDLADGFGAFEIPAFEVTIPGHAAYRLKDRPYPGLFREQGDNITFGKVLLLTPEQRERFDWWETTDPREYREQPIVVVDANGNAHDVTAYIPNEFGRTLRTDEPWTLNTFLVEQAKLDFGDQNHVKAAAIVTKALCEGELFLMVDDASPSAGLPTAKFIPNELTAG